MKKITLLFTIIFILLISVSIFTKDNDREFKDGDFPANILIIAQSSQQYGTFISAIDLDNNEYIILIVFQGGTFKCLRTGIKCDPQKQMIIQGKDAPFETQKR